VESLKSTDKDLYDLSMDFASGYKNLSVMCFYEKVQQTCAGGFVNIEVRIRPDLKIMLISEIGRWAAFGCA
jgi:hypothetical protein